MKVEFKDTQFGSSLCVKTSEFIKSKDGGSEMTSIRRAIRAFYHLYCIDLMSNGGVMKIIYEN